MSSNGVLFNTFIVVGIVATVVITTTVVYTSLFQKNQKVYHYNGKPVQTKDKKTTNSSNETKIESTVNIKDVNRSHLKNIGNIGLETSSNINLNEDNIKYQKYGNEKPGQ